jgi:hypothetical protein
VTPGALSRDIRKEASLGVMAEEESNRGCSRSVTLAAELSRSLKEDEAELTVIVFMMYWVLRQDIYYS